MRWSRSTELLDPDPEIDRILRRLFKEKKDREAVIAGQEERRALRDYAIPSLIGATSCIKKSTIQADNFELKIGLNQMVQNDWKFGGFPNNDPYEHITNLLEICDTQQYSGVPAKKVRLMIFFSHSEIKQGYGSNLYRRNQLLHGMRWQTNSSPNTFHPQNQQNFEVISQPLPNLILNLFIMLGKGTRAWLGKSQIIISPIGWDLILL